MKLSDYAKKNNVTYRTIWNWHNKGIVKIEKSLSGINFIICDEVKEKTVAIYSRVSSSENKDNLERQKQRMIDYCNAKGYKVTKIVCEIGSGLNDKRKLLESLLTDNSIDVIVAEHSDRIARFGLNYIKKLLELQNRELEIINPVDNEKDDLMQDFVSIITSFTARLYGQRRTKRKTEKLIEELNKCN